MGLKPAGACVGGQRWHGWRSLHTLKRPLCPVRHDRCGPATSRSCDALTAIRKGLLDRAVCGDHDTSVIPGGCRNGVLSGWRHWLHLNGLGGRSRCLAHRFPAGGLWTVAKRVCHWCAIADQQNGSNQCSGNSSQIRLLLRGSSRQASLESSVRQPLDRLMSNQTKQGREQAIASCESTLGRKVNGVYGAIQRTSIA